MSVDFILPDIGEGIVECEIVQWNVKEGDFIEEDQSVVEVMTDKAVVEIPAKHSGTVTSLYYKKGDIAKVHTPLFSVAVSDDYETTSNQAPKREVPSSDLAVNASSAVVEGEYEPSVAIDHRAIASPAVRRIAKEHGIDLIKIKGTGKKGRILKCDVVNSEYSVQNVNSSSDQNHDANSLKPTNTKRVEKITGVKAAMAKQMIASTSTIPHFTVSDDVEMDSLIALRKAMKPMFEAMDVKLSFMPFFIKSLSLALNEFPILNSQVSNDGTELHYFSDHNIGIAVDGKIGLMVPNIKQVQDKSIVDITKELNTLISSAREGKLTSKELSGGTISISNIGAIGGIHATPIINLPEVAIVALGKIMSLPRFDNAGNVVAKTIMTVNWSGDHRVIDGATMVRFNNLWMSFIQQPEKMLLHLK